MQSLLQSMSYLYPQNTIVDLMITNVSLFDLHIRLEYPYLFRHVKFDTSELSPSQLISIYSGCMENDNNIEICDHIFIFSDIKLATQYQVSVFGETPIIKTWHA